MAQLAASLFLLAIAAVPARAVVLEGPVDVLIRNGRVIDGTGAPWYHADVAIQKGMIVAVGTVTASAKQTIDARGLIISPKTIDMLGQSELKLLFSLRLTGINGLPGVIDSDVSGPLQTAAFEFEGEVIQAL